MSLHAYPQIPMGYPPPFPQPYPHQQMGFPPMPYPQPMPFHPGPHMPPVGGSRTLWVGDMDEWMNEHWLHATFSMFGSVADVKVIRQRPTGQHAGYGFVEFGHQYEAQHVLNTVNGLPIPNHPQGKAYRLNWATHGLSGAKGIGGSLHGEGGGPEYSLFVGDLAHDVNDVVLMRAFVTHYQSVKSAKVVIDPATGMSKGYGFVKFADEEEKERAMREMNGTYISTRQVRCSQAQKKSDMLNNQKRNNPDSSRNSEDNSGVMDPSNTTLFVGGLDNNINEHMLHHAFAGFGPLVYVRVPHGKACGFVQFADRPSAEAALREMQGFQINMCRLRLSWGRANNTKQQSGLPTNHKHASSMDNADGLTSESQHMHHSMNDDGGNDAPTDAAMADANNARYMDVKEDSLVNGR